MSNMLINIRGTNGTGKSTLMRKFMNDNPRHLNFNVNGRNIKVLESDGNFILGDYTRDCGGLDTTKNLDEVRGLVREYIGQGNVFMEGMMYSTLYESPAGIDDEIAKLGHEYYWVQINIPAQVCIDSTVERRVRNNNFDTFDPIQLIKKWRSIGSAFNKAVADGRLAFAGDRNQCYEAIKKALAGDKSMFQNQPKIDNNIDFKAYPPIKVTTDMIEKFCPKADNNLFDFMV